MATLKVILRGSALNLQYYNKKQLPIPLNISIAPEKFTGKAGNWTKDIQTNINIQQVLDKTQLIINKFYFEKNRYPFTEELKEILSGKEDKQTESFTAVFTKFTYSQTHKGNNSVSIGRMKHYKTFEKIIGTFAPDLKMDEFNLTLFNNFMQWMIDVKKYNDNTVSSKVNILKTFLHWYVKEYKKHELNDLLSEITYKKHHNDTFFHTSEELQKMVYFDITEKHLADTRDRYCLQCLTGIRFSDLQTHKWSFESDYLRKVAVKTGEEIIVPLRKAAKEIIHRLTASNFPEKTNQVYNRQIKEVGLLCGLTQEILIVKGKRKNKPGDIVPKYKLMSSHMARATFVCQMIELDVHPNKIKKMTGIRKSETIEHYAEVLDSSLKETMQRIELAQGF